MFLESAVLGSIGGAVIRMMPEVLNWLDRNSARKHELKMQDVAYKFEQLRGAQRMEELGAQNQLALDTGGLNALVAGIKAQGVVTGVKWIDGLNSSIRPMLAIWWCIVLMTAAKGAQFWLLMQQGQGAATAILSLWGPNELAIVAGIINFFFLDRVVRKNSGL